MKTFQSILALFLFSTVIIGCTNKGTSGKYNESSTVNIQLADNVVQPPENQARPATPKNWPWRGVSMQSMKGTPADVAYLASVNVNFIRIQIKSSKRAQREKADPEASFYKELDWAESLLDACKQHNITTIIAFNHLVLDPNSKIDDKSPEFWSKKAYTDSAYRMVEIIVQRFKDRGDELSAYEVIGEPAVDAESINAAPSENKSAVPDKIEEFYRQVLAIIRKHDEHRYFLLTPGPWGMPTNFSRFDGYNINDTRIIYGAHMYQPHPFTLQGIRKRPKGVEYPGRVKLKTWDKEEIAASFEALRTFQQKHNALIYIGEFQAVRWSPGGDQYVKDVIDVLEKNNWSWTHFGFKSDQIFFDPYYVVENLKADPVSWKLKEVGRESPQWQMLIEYFARNK